MNPSWLVVRTHTPYIQQHHISQPPLLTHCSLRQSSSEAKKKCGNRPVNCSVMVVHAQRTYMSVYSTETRLRLRPWLLWSGSRMSALSIVESTEESRSTVEAEHTHHHRAHQPPGAIQGGANSSHWSVDPYRRNYNWMRFVFSSTIIPLHHTHTVLLLLLCPVPTYIPAPSLLFCSFLFSDPNCWNLVVVLVIPDRPTRQPGLGSYCITRTTTRTTRLDPGTESTTSLSSIPQRLRIFPVTTRATPKGFPGSLYSTVSDTVRYIPDPRTCRVPTVYRYKHPFPLLGSQTGFAIYLIRWSPVFGFHLRISSLPCCLRLPS